MEGETGFQAREAKRLLGVQCVYRLLCDSRSSVMKSGVEEPECPIQKGKRYVTASFAALSLSTFQHHDFFSLLCNRSLESEGSEHISEISRSVWESAPNVSDVQLILTSVPGDCS